MPKYCSNRLTVIGPEHDLGAFQETDWEREAQAKYSELLECAPRRFAVQFETEDRPPLDWMREASGQWSRLVFLLDYEIEEDKVKGLTEAKAGHVEHYSLNY